MSIRPDYLSLDNLLQKRLFRIPEYQRAYSWETRQRNELFDDIRKLSLHNDVTRHHFMATAVCLRTDKKEEIGADEFGIYHIVDGQQRLTTLIILLKAISKKLALSKDKIDSRENDRLEELLVKDDRRLILLQTNHDSSFVFQKYLAEGYIPKINVAKTLAEKNLVDAFEECESFVDSWEESLIDLLKIVKNRLDFIFYVLEDEGAVYTIFEVLNSRGLPVDALDKCKSMLMGTAFEKLHGKSLQQETIHQLHQIWSAIYRTIGLRTVPGHEILRFAATLEHMSTQSKIIGSDDALHYFSEYCSQKPQEILSVSQKFLDIARILEQLYSNSRLQAVTTILHARLLAVAVLLKKTFTDAEKQQILHTWEKVTFRIFGLCRKDSRTKVGAYTRLAREIYRSESIGANDARDDVNDLGLDYPIGEAVKNLQNADCYDGWTEELRYFFYRYEEHLSEQNGCKISDEIWTQVWQTSTTRTIEHIHPQNINMHWRGKFSTRNDYAEKQIQRLGNLVVLPPGVNSKAKDKSFTEKKEIYLANNSLRMLNEIIAESDWNKDAMEKRENRLVEWATDVWQ